VRLNPHRGRKDTRIRRGLRDHNLPHCRPFSRTSFVASCFWRQHPGFNPIACERIVIVCDYFVGKRWPHYFRQICARAQKLPLLDRNSKESEKGFGHNGGNSGVRKTSFHVHCQKTPLTLCLFSERCISIKKLLTRPAAGLFAQQPPEEVRCRSLGAFIYFKDLRWLPTKRKSF
jgi:hypothetical protein